MDAPFLPAISIEPVEVLNCVTVSAGIQAANATMRTRHEIPLFLRGYVEKAIVGSSASGFLLSPFAEVE
ncbi:MAG: hypothetical protein ACFE0O_01830 [Opitutales bacterium]